MKKTCLLIMLFNVFSSVLAQEIMSLRTDLSVDFLQSLSNNKIYLKNCKDIDIADNGDFFFLDANYGTVFRVDGRTGKLLATISSKGQGPNELDMPTSMRVKNKMVFVYDRAYGGVKIFDFKGKLIKSFKVTNQGFGDSIDVNRNDEIYVQAPNIENKTLLSVYNMSGVLLRDIIDFKGDVKDQKNFLGNNYSKFRLDKKENIIVLFPLVIRRLRKYDKEGRIVWEREIKNKILNAFKSKEDVGFGERGSHHFSQSIFNLDISDNNNIIVGHVGGGEIFDEKGNVLKLISFVPEDRNLFLFRLFNNKLLSVLIFGHLVNVYDFIE